MSLQGVIQVQAPQRPWERPSKPVTGTSTCFAFVTPENHNGGIRSDEIAPLYVTKPDKAEYHYRGGQ